MAAPQYATLVQLQDHIDARLLRQLTSDDQTDGALDLSTNTKLKSALERASSDIESHTLRGQRYSADDLAGFQTAGDATLSGLACDLTILYLFGRRGGDLPPAVEERGRYATRILKALADGELIFGKSGAAALAGVVSVSVIAPTMRQQFGLASDSSFFPPVQERAI